MRRKDSVCRNADPIPLYICVLGCSVLGCVISHIVSFFFLIKEKEQFSNNRLPYSRISICGTAIKKNTEKLVNKVEDIYTNIISRGPNNDYLNDKKVQTSAFVAHYKYLFVNNAWE
jgi:hypothetical protein